MKIGIDAGISRLLVFGAPGQRLEYVLEGDPVDGSAEAEHHAAAGEVVLSPRAAAQCRLRMEARSDGFQALVAAKGESADSPSVVITSRREGPPANEETASRFDAPPSISEFFPLPLRSRIAAGDALLLNEHRRVALVFLRFAGADYRTAEANSRLQRFFLEAEAISTRYGGVVSKVDFGDKGSKILCTFGAPVAVENAEEAAVRAALELAASAAGSVGPAAIGVHAGSVFAGDVGSPSRREYTVMGDAVNLSARLMQQAGLGRALASEVVFLASPGFRWEEVPPFQVKGKLALVRAAMPNVGRPGTGTAPPPGAAETQWVPREQIQSALSSRVAALRDHGEGGGLVLVAPAGAGKTALLDRVLREAESSGLAIARHRVRPWETNQPLAWCRAVFPELLGLPGDALVGRLEVRLRTRLAGAGEIAERDLESFFRLLGWKPGRVSAAGESQEEIQGRIGLFARIVDAAAGPAPRVFAIDGAADLDFLSQRVVDALRISGGPRLFLSVARTDPGFGGDRLGIPPLEPGEVRSLVAASVGDQRIDPALAEFVFRRSGGNPLYVVTLVDQLRASEAAGFDFFSQLWKIDESRVASASFDTLESLLLRRLDALPEALRSTAKSASVLGDRFPIDLLGAVGASNAGQTFSDLVEAGILERDGDDAIFADSLLREAVLGSLPASVRSRLHRQAAEVLDRFHKNLLDDRAGHWHEAGEPRRAIPLLAESARRSFRSLLFRSALRDLERLRDDFGRLDERERASFGAARRTAALLEGEIRMLVGEVDGARAALSPEIEGDESGADPAGTMKALDLLSQVAMRQARLEEVVSLAERLREAADRNGDLRSLGSALLLRAGARARLGNLHEAEEDFRTSIGLLEKTRDRVALARALAGLGACLYHRGAPREATKPLGRSVAMLRRTSSRTSLASALINRSNAESELGQVGRQERSLVEAVTILQSSGTSSLLVIAYGNLNVLALAKGQLANAEKWSRLARECASRMGSEADRVPAATVLAYVFLLEKRWADLLELARESIPPDGVAVEPFHLIDLTLTLGRGMAEAGLFEEARSTLKTILARLDGSDNSRVRVVRLLLGLVSGERCAEEDISAAERSAFHEDRLLALAARGVPGGQERRSAFSLLVREAMASGAWLAALEALHLGACLASTNVQRKRDAKRMTKLARRLGLAGWEARAAALERGVPEEDLPFPTAVALDPKRFRIFPEITRPVPLRTDRPSRRDEP